MYVNLFIHVKIIHTNAYNRNHRKNDNRGEVFPCLSLNVIRGRNILIIYTGDINSSESGNH